MGAGAAGGVRRDADRHGSRHRCSWGTRARPSRNRISFGSISIAAQSLRTSHHKTWSQVGRLKWSLGFGITAIASATAVAVLHSGGQIHALMLKAAEQYVSRSTDPQMQQVLDFYASPQGFILMLVIGSIMMLLLFMALSSMGGMIGAAVLRKKDSI